MAPVGTRVFIHRRRAAHEHLSVVAGAWAGFRTSCWLLSIWS